MYLIYADDDLIFNPLLGEKYSLDDVVLSVSVGMAGSLEFTISPYHAHYSDIKQRKSRIKVIQQIELDGEQVEVDIWEGHTVDYDIDFQNNKKFTCEGRLTELRDAILPRGRYGSYTRDPNEETNYSLILQDVIDVYNLQMDESKQLVLGECDLKPRDSGGYISYVCIAGNPTVQEWMNGTSEKGASVNGRSPAYYNACLIPHYQNDGTMVLDFKNDYGNEVSSQVIEFGKNLIDLSRYVTAEEIYTVAYPVGHLGETYVPYYYADAESNYQDEMTGFTNESSVEIQAMGSENHAFNSGNWVVNQSAVDLFGTIVKPLFFEGGSYNSKQAVADAAMAWLNRNFAESITIDISAIDLSLLDVDVDEISLGKYYRVKSAPHNLNALYQCTSVELNISHPEKSSYKFGKGKKTLTEQILNG